jgi:hypothetical protein
LTISGLNVFKKYIGIPQGETAMRWLLLLSVLLISARSLAFEDPTNKKPFFPWLWTDQINPTLENAFSKDGIIVVGTTVPATVLSHQYDSDVHEHNRRGENLIFDRDTAGFLGTLGGGGIGIGIVTIQLFVDQQNGLEHGRAILLTAANHATLALISSRKRPDNRADYLPFDSAFPSGHASSIFATATSLSYSYGWLVGIPSYALATSISLARVSENSHWLSDVVAGAGLGIFWGVASHKVAREQNEQKQTVRVLPPSLLRGGGMVNVALDF